MLSGTAGTSGHPPAERVRRRLWAEHLGFRGADGKPDAEDSRLAAGAPKAMLALWKQQAAAALAHITTPVLAPLPGFVLEYPQEDGGSVDTPRRHLAKLGVPLGLDEAKIRPIGTTRAFDFFSGHWKPPNREDFVGATRTGQH
jgi:hypothetical protein